MIDVKEEELGKHGIHSTTLNKYSSKGTSKHVMFMFTSKTFDSTTFGFELSLNEWDKLVNDFYEEGAEKLATELKRRWELSKEKTDE